MSKKKDRNKAKPRPGPNPKSPPHVRWVEGHRVIEYPIRFTDDGKTVEIKHFDGRSGVFINIIQESARRLLVQVAPIEMILEREAREHPIVVVPGGASISGMLLGADGRALA